MRCGAAPYVVASDLIQLSAFHAASGVLVPVLGVCIICVRAAFRMFFVMPFASVCSQTSFKNAGFPDVGTLTIYGLVDEPFDVNKLGAGRSRDTCIVNE